MSYKDLPFLSKIFVENPSRLTTLSGEGRPNDIKGSATSINKNKLIIPKNPHLAYLAIFFGLVKPEGLSLSCNLLLLRHI